MTAREKLIARIETRHCALSTDGGGKSANHHVKDGACAICDRSVNGLAALHGLA